jgi:hypothetical protein
MTDILLGRSRPTVIRAGAVRSLAVAVALALAAGGAALALSGDDPPAPAHKSAAASAPLLFGDPAVIRGARGGATARVRLQDPASAPVFGDPTVHKGAGGR